MATLEKIEFIKIPKVRIIGRQVSHSMEAGAENPVPALWEDSFDDGSVEKLKKLPLVIEGCTIGWMGDFDGQHFKYIAGVLACENTPVPEGMQYRDLPACNIARGYIHGNLQNGEANVNAHELTLGGIEAHNYTPDYSFGWSAEVYPDSLDFAEEEGTIGYLCPYNPHKTS